MKLLFLLAAILSGAGPEAVIAQTVVQVNATAVAEPRVVLLCRPARVCGQETDAPTFVLYADGFVIFRSRTRTAPQSLLSAQLSEAAYSDLIASIAPRSLLPLADSYEGDVRRHAVSAVLHVWVDGRRKTISVVGDGAPREFRRATEAIDGFSAPGTPWLPESVEAVLRRYEYQGFRTVPWPDDWPAVEVERMENGVIRIRLPKAQFEHLRRLVRNVGPGHAVWAAYQPWHISYRLPFPRESAWMR